MGRGQQAMTLSNEPEAEDKLSTRQQRLKGGGGSKSPLIFVLFFIGIVVAAALLLFPQEVSKILGLSTSESEAIQRTSETNNTGLNTNLRPRQNLDTDQPEPEIVIRPVERPEPEIPAPPPDRSAELEAQIDALQAQIQELLARPAPLPSSGISPEALQEALREQSRRDREAAENREALLRAEMEAKLAALRAPAPSAPAGPDLEEQERLRRLKELEERRAAREAELRERLLSDANIYDESEEGSTSGASEGPDGIQEMSSNERFLSQNANLGVSTSKARDLGDISRTIVQGTIITAVLETAVNTELPGSMRAVVSTPVYSYDGQEILMPKGTRLIGTYNNDVSIAQKRVLIAWNRAITPEGKSISLAATGVDRLGRGGVEGNVDSRFAQRFGTAALITTIAAIPTFIAAVASDGDDTSDATVSLASDVSGDLEDQTENVLEDYLSLPPIIRLPQGYEVKVFVNQDLVF
ncbi:TrbI/VirB10 family protein [Roseibium sp.]|uniref:TrbI/VirB10 family protein n=1 Tax=Roseibium sp. TaxID=1936156 RepID=UPI003B511C5E